MANTGPGGHRKYIITFGCFRENYFGTESKKIIFFCPWKLRGWWNDINDPWRILVFRVVYNQARASWYDIYAYILYIDTLYASTHLNIIDYRYTCGLHGHQSWRHEERWDSTQTKTHTPNRSQASLCIGNANSVWPKSYFCNLSTSEFYRLIVSDFGRRPTRHYTRT